MEKAIVKINDIIQKGSWGFNQFSSEANEVEQVLKESGYPLVPLRDLISKYQRGAFTKIEDQGDIPVISPQCLTTNGIALDKASKFISRTDHEKLQGSALNRDDVIVNLFVGFSSAVAAVYESDELANLSSSLLLIRFNKKVKPKYVSSFLNSSIGRAIIQQKSTGSVQQTINASQILDIYIPLPHLEEQEILLEAINRKQEEILVLEQKILKLKEESQNLIENFLKKK